MNYTLSQLIESNEPLIIYKEDTNNLISSVSLAVCSILLSLSGFMFALHKSRCKNINCLGCLKCDRVIAENSV